MAEIWRQRLRTAEAMLALLAGLLLVQLVPLRLWRGRLGLAQGLEPQSAFSLARHVERAAGRLPFTTRCLSRAVALSLMLRRRDIAHSLVIAARPPGRREGAEDALHAWVECAGAIAIGELPGPWIEAARFGEPAAPGT